MGRLHRAVSVGKSEDIKQYLTEGDDVDAYSVHGFTALMIAAREGHLPIVRQLLSAGANVDLRHANGRATLDFAAGKGSLEVVRVLVAHGADVDGGKQTGRTPALSAALFGHREVALFLLENGADRTRLGMDGLTTEQWIAIGGWPERSKADFDKLRSSPERQKQAEEQVRKLMSRGLTAEEFAATYGRRTCVWGYGQDHFADPVLEAWAHRVAEVLFTPGLLDRCEEQYLQGEALEDARRCRVRRARSAERRKRRAERLRGELVTAKEPE